MPALWALRRLDGIERRYATRELRALVAEIRHLNAIVECAGDLVRALEPARLTTTPKLLLTGSWSGWRRRDGAEEGRLVRHEAPTSPALILGAGDDPLVDIENDDEVTTSEGAVGS